MDSRRFTFLSCIFLIIVPSFANISGKPSHKTNVQVSPTPSVEETPSPAPEPDIIVHSQDEEIAFLNAELEIIRSYDQKLLDTVYWALGIAIGVILFAAGAGWYANFRSYERDKQTFREEIENYLKATATNELSRISKEIDERFQRHSQNLIQIGDGIRQEVSDEVSSIQNSFDSKVSTLQFSLLRLEYKILDLQADFWREKQVFGNVLSRMIDMLPIALEIGWEWMISRTIDGISQAIKSGAKPSPDEKTKITKLMADLPPEYAIVSGELMALMRD